MWENESNPFFEMYWIELRKEKTKRKNISKQ